MSTAVTIPKSEWHNIRETLSQLRAQIDKGTLLSEAETAEQLGITLKTLRNKTSDGTIPEEAIERPIIGRPQYYITKLLVKKQKR